MGEIIGLVAMILFILLIVFLIVAHKSNMSELEKENKKLKEELNFYCKAAKQFRKDKDVLMKENEELEKENKELKMKIDTLELCIKNKDELLEEYRKKIDKFRTDNIYEKWLY